MKTQLLGASSLFSSRLAYGCMRITGTWDRTKVDAETVRKGIATLEAAFEAGYTLFDHADIYGDTSCESVFGEALRKHPDWRRQITLVTKCGIRFDDEPEGTPHRWDFSRDHIVASAEESLRRLGVETIDLLLLHRPDFLADPAEIAAAFTALREAGKVREFGVSNFRPSLLSMVQSALSFPLLVNQVEVHPNRLACFEDGTLDQCLERKITPMAWSPLDRGRVASGAQADPAAPDFARQTELLAALDAAAAAHSTDRTNIVLAWLLFHPSRMIPVVGSVNPERIKSAAKADEISFDRDSWYRILRAARGEKLP